MYTFVYMNPKNIIMNIEQEKIFLQENDAVTNEYEQFIYTSSDGNHIINLPYILLEYKNFLIENKIVSEHKA